MRVGLIKKHSLDRADPGPESRETCKNTFSNSTPKFIPEFQIGRQVLNMARGAMFIMFIFISFELM